MPTSSPSTLPQYLRDLSTTINGYAPLRAASTTNSLPSKGDSSALPLRRHRSSSPARKRRRRRAASLVRKLKSRCRHVLPSPSYLVICLLLVLAFAHFFRIGPSFLHRKLSRDLSRYVNVFRGSANGGGFPGVVPAPFALVKIGPDCVDDPPKDAYSGYLPTGNVTGFSMMHLSGTSGAPKYGIISQMPVTGSVENPLLNISRRRMGHDHGEVGYYRSWLQGGIMVEIAGTDHAALLKYWFKAGGFENSVVVDVSHVLKSYRSLGWSQDYSQGKFQIHNDSHYEGFGVFNGGWNLAPKFTIYFCGYWDSEPYSAETFSGLGEELKQMGKTNTTTGKERQGGVFTFRDRPVLSRVAVSWISSKRACRYIDEEIPLGTGIQDLVRRSKDRWNNEVFSKITTNSDAVPDHLTQLYSNMYAMYITPTNKTGENPKWRSTEPYFDDVATYWDLSRCSMALTHILTPDVHQQQLRSILEIYNREGWLPDARTSDSTGEIQGGTNVDNILADAFVKDVPLNWTLAWAAVQKNAVITPHNNEDPRAPDSSTLVGRGALPDWEDYGYITPNFSRSVSRAVEYAANDFAVYQLARGLEKSEREIDHYLNRSRYWRNHWNSDQKALGFQGFLAPRHASGKFEEPFDPLQCGDCYWKDAFYRALPWEYTFAAGHHDMAAVVNFTGGDVTFIRKLQKTFEQFVCAQNAAFNSSIINPTSKPSFASPYLFHFVDRQDLSVKYSRRLAQFFFSEKNNGLPGNSDSGALESWQLWNMIGLYPMVGQRTFLIGSPWFKEMKIDLGGRKTLKVTQKGGNVNMEAFYIVKVFVNGQPWIKNWVDWSDLFEKGGEIHFELSHTPIKWASGPLPPSPASEDEFKSKWISVLET